MGKSNVKFSPEEIAEAEKAIGIKEKILFSPEEIASAHKDLPHDSLSDITLRDAANAAETSGRSAVEGMTLGASEPVWSGFNAALKNLVDAGYSAKDLYDFASKAASPHEFMKNYHADVVRRNELKEKYPSAHNSFELAGGVAPALITGGGPGALGAAKNIAQLGTKAATELGQAGGKIVDKAAKYIPGMTKALKSKSEGIGSWASKTAKNAVEGATIGGGTSAIKLAAEGPTGFMDYSNPEEKILDSAKFGGKLGSVPGALGALKKGAIGALGGLGQVNPKVISKYLKNSKDINKGEKVEDLKYTLDNSIDKIRENVNTQKLNFANSVQLQLQRLKEKVVKGSADAYDILDRSKGSIDTSRIKSIITAHINEMMPVYGKGAAGKSAKSGVKELESLRETISNYGKEISFPQAKHILQQLDTDFEASPLAGGFIGESKLKFQEVRNGIDAIVKRAVPKYKDAMIEVADNTKKLKEYSEKFGDKDSLIKGIDGMGNGNKFQDIESLEDLQKLSNSRKNNTIKQLNVIQKTAPIMRLNSGNTQKFIQTIFNDSSINNAQTLAMISKLSGENLVVMAENSGLKNQFSKEFDMGSKAVNMWTYLMGGLGSAVGALMGHEAGSIAGMGGIGTAAGAVLGSMVKHYGPKTTKSILDGVIAVNGIPTIRKIDKYFSKVPDDVKMRLKNDLISGLSMPSSGNVVVPKALYQQALIDIDAATNIDSVKKAKAIDSLNRNGSVSSETMREISLDDDNGGTIDQPEYPDEQEIQGLQPGDIIDNINSY